MSRVVLQALWSHWRHHRGQLAMLLLGLSLATALWTGVQAINSEARASYAEAAATLGGDRLSRIVAEDGGLIDQTDYIRLRRAGWLVSPVIEGDHLFGTVRMRLIGLDPATLPLQAQTSFADTPPFFDTPQGLFVAPKDAGRLGQGLLAAEGIPEGVVMADIGVAQRKLGLEGKISRLILAADQPLGRPDLGAVVKGLVVLGPDRAGDVSRLTDSFHLNLTAFGLLSFLVGLFIVQSAVGLVFEQRRAMVRTLRALGVPLNRLMALLVAELVGLSLLAGLIGVGLGFLVARALMPGVAATLGGLYGALVAPTLQLRAEWWATGLAIAVLGALTAAAVYLVQVWRTPILQTAANQATLSGAAWLMRVQALVAVACLLAAGALALWGAGLAAGFGVLAGLFLGAASGLPIALFALLSLGRRLAKAGLAQWFWADLRAQLPALSLAMMALMLAFATNIGVGTMVSSFRQTFVGWLDQRMISELYVTARSSGEADDIRQWLQPQVQAVLPITSTEVMLQGVGTEIFGIVDHATYRDNWPLLQSAPNVWDKVTTGKGALINEQMHYRRGLAVGDDLHLPGGWILPVLGVYSDYGNPQMQVIIGHEALLQHFPQSVSLRMGIRVSPEASQPLAEALRRQFDLPVRNVVNQADIKAISLQIFERTFAVTAALNVLTLGVAGIAMFASLMTLADMRLLQIAPVWAMGLTRPAIVRLEFARTMLLAGLTLVLALPVGLGLAWVLLNIVNVEAFGWRLPMHLFPMDWLRLFGWGLGAAALAAALPVRRLARTSPATLVKVFSNAG